MLLVKGILLAILNHLILTEFKDEKKMIAQSRAETRVALQTHNFIRPSHRNTIRSDSVVTGQVVDFVRAQHMSLETKVGLDSSRVFPKVTPGKACGILSVHQVQLTVN